MNHDISLEKIVLGAILLDYNSGGYKAFDILNENVFYSNDNKVVFRALKQLHSDNEPIDIATVSIKLSKMSVKEINGTPASYYVSKLTERTASSANVEKHAAILYQMYGLREIGKLALELENLSSASGADFFEIINYVEKRFSDLTSVSTGNILHISEVFTKVVDRIRDVIAGNVETGVPTGIKFLDNQTGGWQGGNLILCAARPGMGKTAFAIRCVVYPAMKKNIPTAIFSLEMSLLELGGRAFSSETSIPNTKIIQAKMDAGDLKYMEANVQELIKAPIYIDDTPSVHIRQLKNKIRRLYHEKGVRLFVVDYLQLLSGDSDNREREIAEISRTLKILAKELNVPIIALSQLSREVEKRADKRPQLSDLRESGALEQDADVILFLYRPAYYNLYEEGYPFLDVVLDTKDLMLIDIAKGRSMQTGEIPARFIGETTSIMNYER